MRRTNSILTAMIIIVLLTTLYFVISVLQANLGSFFMKLFELRITLTIIVSAIFGGAVGYLVGRLSKNKK